MTPVELRGERVLLRAFRAEELDVVWEARAGLEPHFAHMRTRSARQRLQKRIERSGRFADGWLDLAIEVDGRLIGEIDARRPRQAMPPGVFELGIALFDRDDRGRGYGSEAIRLLTGHLFDAARAERVQASTAVGNTAMRRVFEKLGFVCEGVLRSYMPGSDGRDDYALYAVIRRDWTSR